MNQYPAPNPYAAPQAPMGVAPGAYYAPQGAHATGARVEGKLLVAPNGAPLPPMCMKCGAPPTHYRAQKYQYTPPWAFLFLGWIGILVFSKRSSFQVPLCETHRASWSRWNLIAGLSWIPGAVFWGLGAALADDDGGVGGLLILVGTLLFFVGLFTALILRMRQVVTPTKIDDAYSWLRGVHPVVLQAVSTPGPVAVPQGYAPTPTGYAPYAGYPG